MEFRMAQLGRMLPWNGGHRRGFSFTEILFAVMILGIGFIMVAAMFPVAIHQTESSNQESITASVARASADYMNRLAAMPLPPAAIAGYTTATISPLPPTPSILLPTFPGAALPAATAYKLPTGRTSMIVPGQTWTMFDGRDSWVYSFVGPPTSTANHPNVLWTSVARNLIQPADMRFGWAVMYRRDMIATGKAGVTPTAIAPAPYAQVIVIGMQSRNAPAYDPTTNIPDPPSVSAPTPFLPSIVGDCTGNHGVILTQPKFLGGPSYADFSNVTTTPTGMCVEGAYIVISNDNVPTTSTPTGMWHGALNGRVFRLGGPQSVAWPMLPGGDLTPNDVVILNTMTSINGGTPPQFDVLVVGRGLSGGSFTGPAQDVTAYSTIVPIPN